MPADLRRVKQESGWFKFSLGYEMSLKTAIMTMVRMMTKIYNVSSVADFEPMSVRLKPEQSRGIDKYK